MRICKLCAFDRCDDTATHCRQCGGALESLDDQVDYAAINSAWFHYLKIPTIGTIELVPGRAFSMGREPRNDLVLTRLKGPKIATIFWTEGYDEATVRTLGGPEQVRVDGVRLAATRTLKGGEELEIGPIRMSYLKRATPVEDAINLARRERRGPDVGRAIAAPTSRRRPKQALERDRRELPKPGRQTQRRRVVSATPAQVAAVLEKTKATGTFRVQSKRGRGWITIMSGAPKHAVYGDLRGRNALDAILRLKQARCQMITELPKRGVGKDLAVTFSKALAELRGARPAPRRAAKPARRPQRRPRRRR